MKLYRPGEDTSPGFSPCKPRPSEIAREKAREKSWLAYFLLECGHYTTYQDQEFWEHARPRRNTRNGKCPERLYFCEVDGKWRKVMPKPKPVVYPETPLF